LIVRLLVTRPKPDAERTASALRAQGHTVTIAPLLHIEPLADADLGAGPWAAVLVTSANAARAIAEHKRFAELRALPVLAVGDRSAQAMRAVGFSDVSSAEGAASDLTRVAAERLKHGDPLLYLAGADRSNDIAGDLSTQNFLVRTAVVYRAVQADALPRVAVDALTGGVGGVLHFSRRSAEAYVNAARAADLAESAIRGPIHFCLSGRIAEPLTQAGAVDIRIAREPTEAALIALIPTNL
jgi:uroporphyrinogen-III synthase